MSDTDNNKVSTTALLINDQISSNRVHLCFISFAYLPIFNIWFSHLEKISLKDLCVVAVDEPCYLALKSRKIRTVLMQLPEQIIPSTRTKLWTQRVLLIHELIHLGINVIHSDADAFWLKNILPFLENNKADLVFSIAYRMPENIVKEWGFILCCGFFEIKSNENTKKFMGDYLKKCREVTDDQLALNQLLFDKGVMWEQQSTEYNHGKCRHYNISIDVMPNSKVSRRPNANLSIFHPSLNKTLIILEKQQQALNGLELCKKTTKILPPPAKKLAA